MIRDPKYPNFVFRVGLFFFGWLRFCQGPVAPQLSPERRWVVGALSPQLRKRKPHLLNLLELDGGLGAAALQVTGGFFHYLVMFRKGQINELRCRFIAREVSSVLKGLCAAEYANFSMALVV
ncbi:MAG TPA: hypothetical protein VIS99_00940 [Terrimicrobiaceae bacterium]